jgi:predicted ATPase
LAILRRVILKGFKSIKEINVEFRPLNVLIGANGAGKSNLVAFFKMLNEMMAGRLQQYIGATGRAQSILHFGPKVTTEIRAKLEVQGDPELRADQGVDAYSMRLAHSAGDTLVFAEETLLQEHFLTISGLGLGSGHQETHLADNHNGFPQFEHAAKTIRNFLERCRVYHFHDTSATSRVKQYWYIGDNRSLLSDAGNLAALLLRFRVENGGAVYQRIVTTVRLIAPFFHDFVLEPRGTGPDVILNWRDKESDQVFGPHQLSDGTLRAMCLITLLMQPENELPDLIVVDEPELGLHPYALNVVASLFKKASHHTQVLISTQSASFLDNFDPEDIVVVNRQGKESQFIRPDAAKLEAWVDEYSLGEVWAKNVIGGGPH